MKNIATRLFFAAAALLAVCCSRDPRPELATLEASKQVEHSCCSYRMEYSFVYLSNYASNAALERIQRSLNEHFFELDSLEAAATPQQAAEAYERRLSEEFGCTGLEEYRWEGYFETSSQAEILDRRILVYTIERSMYAGGAHGMYWTLFRCYRLSDGKLLRKEDVFTEEGLARLPEMIRRQIARDHGAERLEEVSEQEGLCLFDPQTIGPNDNFRLGTDSITFIYNPYEIGCYAMGAVEVTLPRAQLEGMIRSEVL